MSVVITTKKVRKAKQPKNANAVLKQSEYQNLLGKGVSITTNNVRRVRRLKKGTTSVKRGKYTYVIGKGNIADPRNIVASLGRTAAGRSWAIRALHPCGEDLPAGGGAVPDLSTAPCVAPVGRGFWSWGIPTGYDATSTTAWSAAETWSVYLLVVPTIAPLVIAVAVIGTAVIDGSQFNYDISTDFGVWAKAYGSVVTNGYAMINVNFLPIMSTTRLANPSELVTSWRTTSCGVTVHLDASSLANQGTVIFGQVKHNVHIVPQSIEGFEKINLYTFDVPSSEADLTQMDPNGGNHAAKEGLYMPLRIAAPVLNLHDVPSGVKSQDRFVVNDITPRLANTTNYGMPDPDWMVGVAIFKGISKDASLTIKLRGSVEFTPSTNSDWAIFTNPSPIYDDEAIKNVATLQQSMSHGYEARFNDLGGIVKKIGEGISGAGIPIVSDIAKIATPLLGGLSGILSGLFGGK